MPIILKYDFDCGRRGAETLLCPIPSIDLMYFSIIVRSLGAGTLLVVMIIPSAVGLMNSAHKANFKSFKQLLIELT